MGRWRVPAAANPQPAPLSTHHRGSQGVRCFPSVSVRVRWWLSPMLTQPPDPPLLTSLSHGTRRGNLGADDRKTRNHNRPKHHHQLWPEAFLRFLRRRTIRPQSIPSEPCPGRPGPPTPHCARPAASFGKAQFGAWLEIGDEWRGRGSPVSRPPLLPTWRLSEGRIGEKKTRKFQSWGQTLMRGRKN